MDANGNILKSEKKTRISTTDIALLSHDYDIRLALAIEEDDQSKTTNTMTSSIPPSTMISERIKHRTSYQFKDIPTKNNYWKIDFTEIETNDRLNVNTSLNTANQQSNLKQIELEIEMTSSCMLTWLSIETEAQAIEYTKSMTEILYKILNILIPCEQEQTILNDKMFTPIPSEHMNHYYNQINKLNHIIRSVHDNNSNINSSLQKSTSIPHFIGAKPLNITRRNLRSIQTNDYYVTEKSDGLRQLLYIVHDVNNNSPIGVLVSRAKEVKIVKLNYAAIIGKSLKYGKCCSVLWLYLY